MPSSDNFGTAVSIALCWSTAPKLSRQSFFVRKIETDEHVIKQEDPENQHLACQSAVPKISDEDTAAR